MTELPKIICIYGNPAFSKPIEYTFDLIFSVYGVNYLIVPNDEFKPEQYNPDETLLISYGKSCPNMGFNKQIHIYASGFFDTDYLKLSSMPKSPLVWYQGLPVIYSGRGQIDNLVKTSKNFIEANIDIIASSFFMVSRYEEVVIHATDKYGRFPAAASTAVKEGFLDRPVVNEYIELLWQWINSLNANLKRRDLWSKGKECAVCVTHDVDHVRRYSLVPPLKSFGAALKQKNPSLALDIALDYLGSLAHLKRDPYDTFDYMTGLEAGLGIKSSFYFMSGRTESRDPADTISKPHVQCLARRLQAKGAEIGLHASFNSYSKSQLMAKEKSIMDAAIGVIHGCRQHYLRWKTPDTWRIQEKLGFLYDTTLAFPDQIGFRCGICLPFKPFDVIENRRLDIWELPLAVMDGSLHDQDYQNLPPEEAYREIIKLLDTVKKYHGVFVLLWHNSSFDKNGGWQGWQETYEKIMEHVSGAAIWGGTGREVIEWWQQSGRRA